ncbi:hypothetical protein JM83_1908 [Gillisia sp. Hel_I_86]|uniref:hypothetical protein n=1 Tax=Gillisia sp. Hel_I_86 TaxID=1249981 RepID=UPI00119B470E|nr:hypothetical protein [Gillisia sp. Hel_I_86]TVZ26909.1 hypothetical protein JM83_1908 [Gillisia sp. Hel_I_86]
MKYFKIKLALTLILALSVTMSYSQTSQNEAENFSFTYHILGGMTCVLVQHNVADFGIWKTAYKKDAERRKKAGIVEKLILRGASDPNFITVVFELENVKTGKDFFTDPKTAELMGAAGVTSKPTFTYFKVSNSGIPTGDAFLIIQHTVKDYKQWKKAFDNHQNVRSEYKISLTALGKDLDNRLNVVAIFNAEDTNDITSFLEKSNLKEAMKNAAITSEPVSQIMVLNKE